MKKEHKKEAPVSDALLRPRRIQVCMVDILHAQPACQDACPVALALSRSFSNNSGVTVAVTEDYIQVCPTYDCALKMRTPAIVLRFIARFDSKEIDAQQNVIGRGKPGRSFESKSARESRRRKLYKGFSFVFKPERVIRWTKL